MKKKLAQRREDQKEILLERMRDKTHADVYTEMLETCEKDIQQITEEIESIKDYSATIKKRKTELKKTVDLIEEIVKDGAISNANLRMLVEEIKIFQLNKSIDIKIKLKANFTNHFMIYSSGGKVHKLILRK